jgi:hypothetical protein
MPDLPPAFEENPMGAENRIPTEPQMTALRWEGLNSVAALVNAPPIRLAEILGQPGAGCRDHQSWIG